MYNMVATIRQGREDGHGRQGPLGQALAQLDGAIQIPRSWSLLLRLLPRTAPLPALRSYISIYPPTCPARMLACAFGCNTAGPVPTPTTVATCRSSGQRATTFSKKSPPYHGTQDDVSIPLQRLEVDKITGHQSVRGRGGVIAVMHETDWTELSRPSWEREMDLQLSRHEILRYLAGTPNQHRQTIPSVPPDAKWCCTTGAFSQ